MRMCVQNISGVNDFSEEKSSFYCVGCQVIRGRLPSHPRSAAGSSKIKFDLAEPDLTKLELTDLG